MRMFSGNCLLQTVCLDRNFRVQTFIMVCPSLHGARKFGTETLRPVCGIGTRALCGVCQPFVVLCLSCIIILLSGCGGGSGSTSTTPTPTGSFTLMLNPTSVDLLAGLSATVSVEVTSENGFYGPVTVSASGLPAGVTVSSVSAVPGNPGQVTIKAASTVTPGDSKITLNGAYGAITGSATLSLTLTQTATPVQRPFTTVGGGLVSGFYDETRQLLFATNPFLNEVDVLSGQNLAVTARVSVPQPLGIDQMADGKTLVVGTLTQGIATIDEDTLAVTQHLAPNFSDLGGEAISTTFLIVPVAMANGKVLLIGQDVGILLDYYYGGNYLIVWDSNSDTFSMSQNFSLNGTQTIFDIKRSADHRWAIFGGELDDLYLYSSDSDSFIDSQTPVQGAAPFGVRDVALNPNATQFSVASASSISFYDMAFKTVGTLDLGVSSGFVFQPTGLQYSADGSKVYWELYGANRGGGSVVDVVDTSTFKDLGNVTTAFAQLQFEPQLLWVDSQQRAFESSQGGVGIFDCTNLRVGSPTAPGTLPSPTSIPLNNTASISFAYWSGSPPPTGSVVTFGGKLAAIQSTNPLTVEAPASSVAGPVDVVVTLPDGETEVEPQEFSYGLDVVAATSNLVPPTGNPSMGLFGFGLLNDNGSPSVGPTSVTIGGVPAVNSPVGVVGASTIEAVAVQIPNGKPGPVDIVVTGSNGTGTLKGALTYIPSATIVSGASFVQLLYDTGRNWLYALSATEVDVLNPTTLQWQSPLLPSSGKGYVSIALTPDGSSLLILDSSANTLTVVNPDSPTQESVTSLPSQFSPPTKVVATNTGKAFIATGQLPIEFDLATLTPTLRNDLSLFSWNTFAATPDGSQLVIAQLGVTSGEVGEWNSSSDSFSSQLFQASQGGGFWSDLAVRSNGSVFAALTTGLSGAGVFAGFFDPQLHYLNTNVYPDLAQPDALPSVGAIFSPSGQTLVVPIQDSIEFFNVSTGKLTGRLLTPQFLPLLAPPATQVTGAIALDPTATIVYAVCSAGVQVLTLPESVDQLTPPTWPFILSGKHSGNSKRTGKGQIQWTVGPRPIR